MSLLSPQEDFFLAFSLESMALNSNFSISNTASFFMRLRKEALIFSTIEHSLQLFKVFDRCSALWASVFTLFYPFSEAVVMEVMLTFKLGQLVSRLIVVHANATGFIGKPSIVISQFRQAS